MTLSTKIRGFYGFYICSQWAFIHALLSCVPFALAGLSCFLIQHDNSLTAALSFMTFSMNMYTDNLLLNIKVKDQGHMVQVALPPDPLPWSLLALCACQILDPPLLLYTVLQKSDTPTHIAYRQLLNGFSNFFHWHTVWKICDKTIIKDPSIPKTRCCTTL